MFNYDKISIRDFSIITRLKWVLSLNYIIFRQMWSASPYQRNNNEQYRTSNKLFLDIVWTCSKNPASNISHGKRRRVVLGVGGVWRLGGRSIVCDLLPRRTRHRHRSSPIRTLTLQGAQPHFCSSQVVPDERRRAGRHGCATRPDSALPLVIRLGLTKRMHPTHSLSCRLPVLFISTSIRWNSI
jgi:hypothetical protein